MVAAPGDERDDVEGDEERERVLRSGRLEAAEHERDVEEREDDGAPEAERFEGPTEEGEPVGVAVEAIQREFVEGVVLVRHGRGDLIGYHGPHPDIGGRSFRSFHAARARTAGHGGRFTDDVETVRRFKDASESAIVFRTIVRA